MTHRLRLRAALDVQSLSRVLKPEVPSTRSAWTWPLERPAQPAPTQHAVSLSVVRAAAVSDGDHIVGLVTRNGIAVIASQQSVRELPVPHDICVEATSVVLFKLCDRTLVALGYASGALAVFDATSTRLVLVTRPANAPVRRLRFCEALHWGGVKANQSQSALFAVLGWKGLVALLPSAVIEDAFYTPQKDLAGKGWMLWSLSNQELMFDAVPSGPDPKPICELDLSVSHAPLRVVTSGVNPPLMSYSCSRDAAFSASAAAKKAANSVLSFAKGFFNSHIAGVNLPGGQLTHREDDSERAQENAVTASATAGTVWTDQGSSASPFLLDVTGVGDSARKSVNAMINLHRRKLRYRQPTSEDKKQSVEGDSSQLTAGKCPPRDGDMDYDELAKPRSRGPLGSMDGFAIQEALDAGPSFPLRRPSAVVDLPQNARVVERLATSPLSCGLIATCDTLGRIFVQDPRDMCVLRVLKGYREGQIAWLANGGPLLVTLAPKLSVLEVHAPFEEKKRTAFRVPAGSRLVQTPSFCVYCVTPAGGVYEVSPSKKVAGDAAQNGLSQHETTRSQVQGLGRSPKRERHPRLVANARTSGSNTSPAGERMHLSEEPSKADELSGEAPRPPDSETIKAFLDAARAGHLERAADVLEAFSGDSSKVAHLMAMLLTCVSPVRYELHAELAAQAARLAANDGARDLEVRYTAHGRLAKCYGLVSVDDSIRQARPTEDAGLPRLRNDEVGSDLAENVLNVPKKAAQKRENFMNSAKPKRGRNCTLEDNTTCERFILAHTIAPTSDFDVTQSFTLQPREDLRTEESIWLAKTYFGRLLTVDVEEQAVTAEGERLASHDVFQALSGILALSMTQIANLFVTFFLESELEHLLDTPAPKHTSSLRRVLSRLRKSKQRRAVDDIILGKCETTPTLANAILLVRLCAIQEDTTDSASLANFLDILERLNDAIVFRGHIAGSSISDEDTAQYTAREFSGIRGDVERRVVSLLIAGGEYERAVRILNTLNAKTPPLEWHELSSVSEAAIAVCRRRLSVLLDVNSYKVLPSGVVEWIRTAEQSPVAAQSGDPEPENDRALHFQGVRDVMLAAHEHVPDASVDAVRCLQLAEAMTAVLNHSKGVAIVDEIGDEQHRSDVGPMSSGRALRHTIERSQ